jgi:hypothetical protein
MTAIHETTKLAKNKVRKTTRLAARELFQTKAAQAYVGQQRRLQDIRPKIV